MEDERLRDGVDGELAAALGYRQADLRLQRRVLDRAGAVASLDDAVCGAEAGLDVSENDLAKRAPVVEKTIPFRSYQRSAGLHRLQWVEDRLLIVDLHGYPVQCAEGRFFVHSRHGGDRLAFEANRLGENRLIGNQSERVIRNILVGDDGSHARERPRVRGVDAAKSPLDHRTPEDLDHERPGDAEIVHESRLSGDVGQAVVTLLSLSYNLEVHQRLSRSPSLDAASITESMIFTYPVHLQRLPETASWTSSRVGEGFSSSRALAARIIPGVQNPHWAP